MLYCIYDVRVERYFAPDLIYNRSIFIIDEKPITEQAADFDL